MKEVHSCLREMMPTNIWPLFVSFLGPSQFVTFPFIFFESTLLVDFRSIFGIRSCLVFLVLLIYAAASL